MIILPVSKRIDTNFQSVPTSEDSTSAQAFTACSVGGHQSLGPADCILTGTTGSGSTLARRNFVRSLERDNKDLSVLCLRGCSSGSWSLKIL